MLFMLQIGTQVNKTAIKKAKCKAPTMHYVCEVQCSNCLTNTVLTIPKGMEVDDYAERVDCPNCGCKIIDRGFSCES
jgi:hypothetical protein